MLPKVQVSNNSNTHINVWLFSCNKYIINIKMDLTEIGNNTRDWVDSVQDRDYWKALVNAALNLRVP